ncbi:velvet factor-domain-containing protein [Mycena crocata]|nr:velvet factor-domain-containing protein [Mycena crocata]
MNFPDQRVSGRESLQRAYGFFRNLQAIKRASSPMSSHLNSMTDWRTGAPHAMERPYWSNRDISHSQISAPALRTQMEDQNYLHHPIPPPFRFTQGLFPGVTKSHHYKPISPAKTIGVPIHFAKGQFAGNTIRAELHEIQRPEYGRRFGAVDKRVLDDPPVVLVRIFYVHNVGTLGEWQEEVENYEEMNLTGLICMGDLFEVPKSTWPDVPQDSTTNPHFSPAGSSEMPTLALLNGQSITEEHNRTPALFGTKFVEPQAISFTGSNKKWLVFTFSDLAVRLEGSFILRYRFFDLFSQPDGCTSPSIMAECYGAPFKIYSTKEAPALEKSTLLTQCLAEHGVHVNLRKDKRARRTKTRVV